MSGGAYDYVSWKIEEFANTLSRTEQDPRREAFKKLLSLVANAAHEIEWVDSCDKSPGDEHDSIDAVFAFLGKDPAIIKKAAAYDSLKDRLLKYLNEGEALHITL